MKKNILSEFLLLLLFPAFFATAQVFQATPFPRMPYRNITASIIEHGKGFYLAGRSGQTDEGVFDNWYTYSRPFFILSPTSVQQQKIILFPKMEAGYFFGLGGNSNRLSVVPVRTKNDSFFTAWSEIQEEYTDVGPFVYRKFPELHLSKLTGDSLVKIFSVPSGLHPDAAVEDDGTLHVVFEKVNPIDTGWGSNFSRYSSEIMCFLRNSSGEITHLPSSVKGFFPMIRSKNGKQHLLFIQADSSNQMKASIAYRRRQGIVFDSIQHLFTIDYDGYHRGFWDSDPGIQWSVDDSGSVHFAWRSFQFASRKIVIGHYLPGIGVQIDSLNDPNAALRFTSDGKAVLYSLTGPENGTSRTLDQYESRYGSPIQKIRSLTVPGAVTIKQFISGRNGDDNLLLQTSDVNRGLYIVSRINSDSANLILIAKGYDVGATSYVDSTNTVWLTGSFGDKYYLLHFSLDSVGSFRDFYFPLNVGDEWYYYVYPDASQQFPETDIMRAAVDTMMHNGKTYTKITSRFTVPQYFRKEGLRIYQYRTIDSTERIRFDFAAGKGDTLWKDPLHSMYTIFVQDVVVSNIFLPNAREFQFIGSVMPNSEDNIVHVTDSLGISYKGSMKYTWMMLGATIDGKIYGTKLAVKDEQNTIPASFALFQNYPNPFNPLTRISFDLPKKNFVSLQIFDVLGRSVATLVNEERAAGRHSLYWDASSSASGTYIAVLRSGSYWSTKKLLLLR